MKNEQNDFIYLINTKKSKKKYYPTWFSRFLREKIIELTHTGQMANKLSISFWLKKLQLKRNRAKIVKILFRVIFFSEFYYLISFYQLKTYSCVLIMINFRPLIISPIAALFYLQLIYCFCSRVQKLTPVKVILFRKQNCCLLLPSIKRIKV